MNKTTKSEPPPKLTASNLKNALWDTLQDIRAERMQPGQGDAIACQAREILRAVKVQLQVAAQTNRKVTSEVIDFSEQ